jgi:hypothetical protein
MGGFRGIQVYRNQLKNYVWRDKEGLIIPDANKSLTLFNTANYGYKLDEGESVACLFHMPHEWVQGSDIYLHPHWGHNGTGLSGNWVWTVNLSYAHRAAAGSSAVPVFAETDSAPISITSPTMTTHPRYCHAVNEILIANKGATGGALLDTNQMATDGIILATFTLTTEPTIGTGHTYFFTGDLHYQANPFGTSQKDPDENYNYNY